jgi:uncharacterized membrane protein
MAAVTSADRLRRADPPVASGPEDRMKNVGDLERTLSLLAGAVLALAALKRRTAGSLLAGAAGIGLLRRGVTGYCAAYRALGMSTAARDAGRDEVRDRGQDIRHTIRVHRPPEELFRFWRDFSNLPRIMRHLESVEVRADGTSRWTTAGPLRVSWTARVTEERPDELMAWESLEGSDVHSAGVVRFRPAPGGGTELHVRLSYAPPAGVVGRSVAVLAGSSPARQIAEDLRRFKQVMEAGELSTTEGQPRGR